MGTIRVMIVDDSRVAREFLQHIIASDPRFEIVATADCAEQALRMLDRVAPDVISMDIHLPGMDGFQATQRIMEQRPTPIVVVSSTMHAGALATTMNALRTGALSVLQKPSGARHPEYQTMASRLCTQLAIMSQVKVVRQRFNRFSERRDPKPVAIQRASLGNFQIVGIVASTGGPRALHEVLGPLPADFSIPIVLVQHITDSFHEGFVSWLNGNCSLNVTVAKAGMVPEPGNIYVAPVNRHLSADLGRFAIAADEPVCSHRPSGTVLLRSLAHNWGPRAIGVVLTGMGTDGAEGLKCMSDAGGRCIVEDASTAVVYGMPAAAVKLGTMCESLPLDQIGPRLEVLAQPAGKLSSPAR